MASEHEPVVPTKPSGGVMGDAIGIDLGGTKIEAVRMASDGTIYQRRRITTPRYDYRATIEVLSALVAELEADDAHKHLGAVRLPVGIGIPGSISQRTGKVRNANSVWLNGQDFKSDITLALQRSVTVTNDANCFALSEATDGAGAGFNTVLGVIVGTGTGSGIVIDGKILNGPLGIAGEFGHNPLPWPNASFGECHGPLCWCGRSGCVEAWVSGPAMTADHVRHGGSALDAATIADDAANGDRLARATLHRHANRLARSLAHVVNVIDPDVIVLGGGLSHLTHLYGELPALMGPHIFCDDPIVDVRPPVWGDASGVRGAGWLSLFSKQSVAPNHR